MDEEIGFNELRFLVARDRPAEGFWYHATEADFDHFTIDSDSPRTHDWNAALGIHFCRDAEGIFEEICFEDGSRVIEVRLALSNPYRAASEFDLDRLALQLAASADWLDHDQILAASDLLAGEQQRYRMWLAAGLDDAYDLSCHFRALLFNEPERAAHFRALLLDHLRAQGHDGIVYGNAIDFPCICAIVFDVAQIEVTDPRYLERRRQPQETIELTLLPEGEQSSEPLLGLV